MQSIITNQPMIFLHSVALQKSYHNQQSKFSIWLNLIAEPVWQTSETDLTPKRQLCKIENDEYVHVDSDRIKCV